MRNWDAKRRQGCPKLRICYVINQVCDRTWMWTVLRISWTSNYGVQTNRRDQKVSRIITVLTVSCMSWHKLSTYFRSAWNSIETDAVTVNEPIINMVEMKRQIQTRYMDKAIELAVSLICVWFMDLIQCFAVENYLTTCLFAASLGTICDSQRAGVTTNRIVHSVSWWWVSRSDRYEWRKRQRWWEITSI